MHACIHTYTHTTHICSHTHTHTHVSTDIHNIARAHTHTPPPWFCSLVNVVEVVKSRTLKINLKPQLFGETALPCRSCPVLLTRAYWCSIDSADKDTAGGICAESAYRHLLVIPSSVELLIIRFTWSNSGLAGLCSYSRTLDERTTPSSPPPPPSPNKKIEHKVSSLCTPSWGGRGMGRKYFGIILSVCPSVIVFVCPIDFSPQTISPKPLNYF